MMMMTAGPIRTMNRVGKMQPIMGKSIFSGAGAAAHFVERFQARPAEPDLVEHLGEFVREGVLELLRQAANGGIETEAGFDGDGQQVEGVGEREAQLFLAPLDLVVEPDVGQEAAEHEADAEAGG